MVTIKLADGRTYLYHTGQDADGRPFARDYRTNPRGEGLWIWTASPPAWKQLVGTGQIALRGSRATIRRRFLRAVGREG